MDPGADFDILGMANRGKGADAACISEDAGSDCGSESSDISESGMDSMGTMPGGTPGTGSSADGALMERIGEGERPGWMGGRSGEAAADVSGEGE